MSISTPVEAVQQFFERFGGGDLPGLVALFADEVDFHVQGAPEVPWTGGRSTKSEIEAFFTTLGTELTTEAFGVDQVLGNDETGIAIGSFTQKVNSTGKSFSSAFVLQLGVRAGQVVTFRFYEDSWAIAQAFAA